MNAQLLHKQIESVCPINGVSIGNINDRSTWRIDFKDEATSDQRIAAQGELLAFDITLPDFEVIGKRNAEVAEQERLLKDLNAAIEELPVSQQDVFNLLLPIIIKN